MENLLDVIEQNIFVVIPVALVIGFFLVKKVRRKRNERKNEMPDTSKFLPQYMSDLTWAIGEIKKVDWVLKDFKFVVNEIEYQSRRSKIDANRDAEYHHGIDQIVFLIPSLEDLKKVSHRGKYILEILLHETVHGVLDSNSHGVKFNNALNKYRKAVGL